MIRLWHLLIHGHYCVHTYEVLGRKTIEGDYVFGGGHCIRETIVSRCTRCGKVETKRVTY